MRIAVDINHPAHVHYFKNFIWEMQKKGHEICITASQKDVNFQLLNAYNLNFFNLGSYGREFHEKLINIPLLDMKMFKRLNQFKPDILIGFASIRASHCSKLLHHPCINFTDTEHTTFEQKLFIPFSDVILTPNCFKKDFGKKHIRFNSYMELASLHPKYFSPNQEVFNIANIEKGEKFVVMRLSSWEAQHDIGQKGILSLKQLINEIEKYAKVIIFSENGLANKKFPHTQIIPPQYMHDLLYYASLYIGEGATSAMESAILGTNAIYISTFNLSNLHDIQVKYGLVHHLNPLIFSIDTIVQKSTEILTDQKMIITSKSKREKIINDNINLTQFMVKFVEDYRN